MKRINKEKIEFLQPLQECQPMNQQNKFSPEINKHDISAGSYRRTEGDRCRSHKVQGAPDRKRSRLLNQESLWQGGLYSWSCVMKAHGKARAHMPWSRNLTPQIYSLI